MPDPDFQPLSPEPPVLDTVLFGGAAIFVFFRMCSYKLNPIAQYRSLAWKFSSFRSSLMSWLRSGTRGAEDGPRLSL